MSSYDGGGFEEWVRDSVYGNVSEEQIQKIIAVLEPIRNYITDKCDNDYDEDTMSWREYRNSLWHTVPDELEAQVDAILHAHDDD